MSRQILAAALLVFCVGFGAAEAAQPNQVVEDKDVGVRFLIPKDWTWRSRDRDIFVNCAPKVESRPGMPGCYFTVQKFKAPPGQTAFTDADRARWKASTYSDGMRPIILTRDLKVAGFPAFEVVAQQGRERGASTGPRLLVLVPELGVIDAWLYAQWNDEDQSPRFTSAFRAALDSLQVAK